MSQKSKSPVVIVRIYLGFGFNFIHRTVPWKKNLIVKLALFFPRSSYLFIKTEVYLGPYQTSMMGPFGKNR